MRVLVLGSSGMLGVAVSHQLRQAGFDVTEKDRSSFDARNMDLDGLVPDGVDAVINACGMINRRLSQPEQDFLRVNCLFPRRLADECQSRSIRMVHISTDCVFKGDHAPYLEDACTDAVEFYGMSKSWGEPLNAMVIRTSIIGPELFNHYSLLYWFLNQQGAARGFLNHFWNGLTTIELARVIGQILSEGMWKPGVQHVFSEDVSKFELLGMMKRTFDLNTNIDAVNDVSSRDTRLRTTYPAFVQTLNIAPLQEQINALLAVSDRKGNWAPQA